MKVWFGMKKAREIRERYIEMLDTLLDDISAGAITKNSYIEVYRSDFDALDIDHMNVYLPIDKIYAETDLAMFATPLEKLFDKEIYSEDGWKMLQQDMRHEKMKYIVLHPYLKKVQAKEIIKEMQNFIDVIGPGPTNTEENTQYQDRITGSTTRNMYTPPAPVQHTQVRAH